MGEETKEEADLRSKRGKISNEAWGEGKAGGEIDGEAVSIRECSVFGCKGESGEDGWGKFSSLSDTKLPRWY